MTTNWKPNYLVILLHWAEAGGEEYATSGFHYKQDAWHEACRLRDKEWFSYCVVSAADHSILATAFAKES